MALKDLFKALTEREAAKKRDAIIDYQDLVAAAAADTADPAMAAAILDATGKTVHDLECDVAAEIARNGKRRLAANLDKLREERDALGQRLEKAREGYKRRD